MIDNVWNKDAVRGMVPKGYSVVTEWIGERNWTHRIISKDGRCYEQVLSIGSGGWYWATEWPKDLYDYD